MKKLVKILSLTLALIMVMGLMTACGGDSGAGEKEDSGKKDTQNESSGKTGDAITAKKDGYVFTANGVSVIVDDLADPVIKALGDPKSTFTETSCAFEGEDKHCIYSNFEILTYPSPDGDRIQAVYLNNDLVKTAEGLKIGDSKAKVEELYGTGAGVSGNQYTYEKGGMSLMIIVENDAVTSISYASDILGTVTQ